MFFLMIEHTTPLAAKLSLFFFKRSLFSSVFSPILLFFGEVPNQQTFKDPKGKDFLP